MNCAVIGKNIFIRTVTQFYIGRVESVTDSEILLRPCVWIANTGNFRKMLFDGSVAEAHPYPEDIPVGIMRQAVIDSCPWVHDLPVATDP